MTLIITNTGSESNQQLKETCGSLFWELDSNKTNLSFD